MDRSAESLRGALEDAYPELALVREAAAGEPVFVVGGAVRDLLLGRERSDLDLVVLGDAAALASRLSGEATHHERFATAKVPVGEHHLDIATARTESYPRPGALPEVEPADDIEADLGRRDFSINAMAVPVVDAPQLIDPFGGLEDLREGVLRVLHERSIADDPTRAVRAARYAARFGFRPEPATLSQVEAADLGTVSADRLRAELLRLAREPSAIAGLELLTDWGAIRPAAGGLELARRVQDLLSTAPWAGFAPRDEALLAAALEPTPEPAALGPSQPATPSEGVARASGRRPVELAVARASGARWLDAYLAEWSRVRLEIDGEDLIAAGVPEGPAVGRGLSAALRRKLDGEIDGREAELEAALVAAGGG
jgi:tRNA nucleotidyltransferase (CCA-adding enzyme)